MTYNKEEQKTAMPGKQADRPQAGAEPARAEEMRLEIKKVWNKLSDDDVKLYERQPDLFFARVKEKHGVQRADAQKRLEEIKAAGGASRGSEKAA